MRNLIAISLVILILGSLGLMGYLFYAQNPNSFESITNLVTSAKLPSPQSLFPVSNESSTSSIANEDNANLATNTVQNTPESTTNNNPDINQLNVAGLSLLNIGNTVKTVFIEQGSGHIYTLDSQNNLERWTNSTFPEVGEAYFGTNKNIGQVIFRQVKNNSVTNQAGQFSLATSSELREFKTFLWPVSLLSLAMAPNGQKLAYLASQTNSGANIYLSDWNLQKPSVVWSSPTKDWLISWPNENLITITSRPTYDYPGILYFLDLKTKQSKKVLSEINGLITKTSPDGQKLIYSKSLLNTFSLYQYDKTTNSSRLLELNTLPDKCTWSSADIIYCAIPKNIPAGKYPDDWYQGKVSFSDDLWKIDLKQKTTVLIKQLKGNYDLTKLLVNEQTGWLYAINKDDQTLQSFSLRP